MLIPIIFYTSKSTSILYSCYWFSNWSPALGSTSSLSAVCRPRIDRSDHLGFSATGKVEEKKKHTDSHLLCTTYDGIGTVPSSVPPQPVRAVFLWMRKERFRESNALACSYIVRSVWYQSPCLHCELLLSQPYYVLEGSYPNHSSQFCNPSAHLLSLVRFHPLVLCNSASQQPQFSRLHSPGTSLSFHSLVNVILH